MGGGVEFMGLLWVILGLIMVNDRGMSDSESRPLSIATPLPSSVGIDEAAHSSRLESFLRCDMSKTELLHHHLSTHFSIKPTTPLPFTSPTSTSLNPLTLPTFLTALVKQNYLEKVKSNKDSSVAQVGTGGGTGGGGGSGDFEYRWGARAEAEIGEMEVAEFMAEM